MITSIVSVIAWLVANQDLVKQGEQVVVDAVQGAISAWNSFTSGAMTQDQLQAAWTAAGVDLAAVEAQATAAGL